MSLSHVSFSILLTMEEDSMLSFLSTYFWYKAMPLPIYWERLGPPFPLSICWHVIMLTWAHWGRFLLSLSLFFPRVAKQRYIQSWIPSFFFHRVYVKPIHENLLHNKLTHIPTKRAFHKLSISAYQFLQGRLIYT